MTAPLRTESRRDASTLLYRVLASSAADPREAVVETALDLLQLRPEHHVLELGCGTGDILSRLAARVLRGQVVGVAVSALMARHARRRNRIFLEAGRAQIFVASGLLLAGLPDARFERVLGVHVIYLWEDPARRVAEVRRVLRPGGRLVLGFRGPGTGSRGPKADPEEVSRWLAEGGFDQVARHAGGDAARPLAWICARRA